MFKKIYNIFRIIWKLIFIVILCLAIYYTLIRAKDGKYLESVSYLTTAIVIGALYPKDDEDDNSDYPYRF